MLKNYTAGENMGWKTLPTGTYQAMLVEVMEKNSVQAGDYLELTWKVLYPHEYDTRSIYERFYLHADDPEMKEMAEVKYNRFCNDMGVEIGGKPDWDSLLMQQITLKIYSGTYNSKDFTSVTKHLPLSSFEEESAKDKVEIKKKKPVSSTRAVSAEPNDKVPF